MKIQYHNSATEIHDIKGDILILTGDCMQYKESFLKWCAESYAHTYIVMGNEDYYDGPDVNETLDSYVYNVYANVTFVNNASVKMGDREIFFSTLWKPVDDINTLFIDNDRDDFYRIRCNGGNLTIDKEVELHSICSEWLCAALFESSSEHKVVVTHHDVRKDKVLCHFLKVLGADAFYSHAY